MTNIWLARPFEQLHLLLLFRSITGFIPTHMVIRLLEFEIRFDLTTYVKNSEVRILRVSYLLIRLFDFNIFLFAFLTRVSLWGTIKKMNKSELWNCLSYRVLLYFFKVGSQNFRNDYKISRSQPQHPSYFDLNGLKTASEKILKIASNQCKSSKYWWEVWILGRGYKKTKRPQ